MSVLVAGPDLRVEFQIDDDAAAAKIHALLSALGYRPARRLADELGRQHWAIERLRVDYGLTPLEVELARHILAGRTHADAAQERGVSEATAAWWRHALLTKTGARDDDELRELARATLA